MGESEVREQKKEEKEGVEEEEEVKEDEKMENRSKEDEKRTERKLAQNNEKEQTSNEDRDEGGRQLNRENSDICYEKGGTGGCEGEKEAHEGVSERHKIRILEHSFGTPFGQNKNNKTSIFLILK